MTRFDRLRSRLGTRAPFGTAGLALLLCCFAAALALRLYRLDSAGLADDEVHKWLAALRYLRGDFGGDDLEHPMLLKSLIALGARVFPAAPLELLTRWPAAVAGALTVPALALLGRRLFGRSTGLLAAAILAVSATAVGYHRVAKEDALLGLFLVLHLWCCAEAAAAADELRARDQLRWELCAAAALGAMLASKYFVFLAPAGLIAWLWLRPVSRWRVPLARLPLLIAAAGAVFLALNWTPLLPSSWDYLRSYTAGERVETPSILFDGALYRNLPFAWHDGVPLRYWAEFALAKLTPPVFLAACAGLGLALWRRRPGERVVLGWLLLWCAVFVPSGAKYARYATAVLPAVALLAALAVVELGRAGLLLCGWRTSGGVLLRRRQGQARRGPGQALTVAAAALAVFAVSSEVQASLAGAPFYRHYLSPLAGGEARLTTLFPHCDLWDEGVREAVQRIAREALPGDAVASDAPWPVKLYLENAGRFDVEPTLLHPGLACAQALGSCWVLAQPGRVYLHNRPALRLLERERPAFTVEAGGVEAVRVYRLEPGASPFPVERSENSSGVGAASARP